MKIGIDARLWSQTGVGRYIRNLVFELSKIDKENSYLLFLRKEEFQTLKLPGKNFSKKLADVRWHSLAEQIKYPAIIADENLDLMHFTYFSIPIFYNRPYIVTIHDLINHHFPTGEASTKSYPFYFLKQKAYKIIIKISADRAKKIIAVSKSTKDDVMELLGVPEQKIKVIYEGVDKELTLNKTDAKSLSKFNNYFLFVGNAYPHKNLDFFIHSFLQIKSDAKLLLVGKEDYFSTRLKHKFKDYIDAGKIIFFGYASNEQLAYFYNNAIATVIPSLMEGFGLPALEAMSNNCLVIAAQIPSLFEICGENALYFDPLSSASIQEALTEVLKNKNKYLKLLENAKKRSLNFSFSKMAKETLEVYKSV